MVIPVVMVVIRHIQRDTIRTRFIGSFFLFVILLFIYLFLFVILISILRIVLLVPSFESSNLRHWHHYSNSISFSTSFSSSSATDPTLDYPWMEEVSHIEMIQDEFMVLTNVCLTNGARKLGPYAMHFFGSNPEDFDVDNDPIRLFQDKLVPYTAWDSDILLSLAFNGTPAAVRTNRTMREFLMEEYGNVWMKSYTFWNGTTVIAEPHHPDNNFHLNNDLILPALFKIIMSASKDVPSEHTRTLLLTHGSQQLYEQRVIGFDVLYQLFDDVRYSLEQIMREESGGVLCFERLILGGRETTLMPYYSHRGRFGIDDRWKGIVPEIRDWVNSLYGITIKRPPIQNWRNYSGRADTKPQLTFIDRPCSVYDTRCLQNVADVVQNLSIKFNVTLLSFNKKQNRSEQLTYMLEIMANTDILAGMHGAGLAHAMYLQPGTILVEIKDRQARDKKLFMNMASIQDIGYYLYDALPASTYTQTTILSDEEMEQFTADLCQVWEEEQDFLRLRNSSDPVLQGECVFPKYLTKASLFPKNLKKVNARLSTFNLSRCYLEQAAAYDNEWWQCTHYRGCTFR